jgi:hypothetical protein
MERNITIGLVIALVLTCVGAFWMSSHSSDGGGFLLDFLKNSTTNTTTADNLTFNETINQTTNTTDNLTVVNQLSFSIAAIYDNSTNSSLVSITSSQDNISVSQIAVFTSYDNTTFTESYTANNVTLPTTATIPIINDTATELYYYTTVLYNNTIYRVPENGSEVLNISTQ